MYPRLLTVTMCDCILSVRGVVRGVETVPVSASSLILVLNIVDAGSGNTSQSTCFIQGRSAASRRSRE